MRVLSENQASTKRVLSEEQKARKRERDIARYDWYKEHGICVHCGRNTAMINSISCPDCSYKRAEKQRERRQNNIDKCREKDRIRCRERRRKRKAAGLCTNCGKKTPYKSRAYCYECMIKSQAHRRKYLRIKNCGVENLRSQFFRENDLCSFCGKPVIPGKRTCEKHYKMLVESIAYARKMRKQKFDAAASGTYIGLGIYKQ